MEVENVLEEAKNAKANGSTRFCMGAAWQSPKDHRYAKIISDGKGVKDIGLETCMTLGMLKKL